MFAIPATSKTIITIVVCAIAFDATVGLITLSYCLIKNLHPANELITAYVGLTSGLVGSLTGLLINTRSSPGSDSDMPKVTAVVTDKPTP